MNFLYLILDLLKNYFQCYINYQIHICPLLLLFHMKQIEEALCGGTTSVEEITKMSKRLPVLNDELDEKSMRWLELSEI